MRLELTPPNICSNMRRSCCANINMAGVGTPVQIFTSGKLRQEPKLMKAVTDRSGGSNEGDACRLVMISFFSSSDCCSATVFQCLAASETETSRPACQWLFLVLPPPMLSSTRKQLLPVRNWWALGVWMPPPTSVSQSVAVLFPWSKYERPVVQHPEADNVSAIAL